MQAKARQKLVLLDATVELRICSFHLETDWKSYKMIGTGSTASGSITNGASALSGEPVMLMTLKSLTTIKQETI